MPDREKVIKGLECCSKNYCAGEECPYYGTDCDSIKTDALDLLKEQESKPDKCIICEGCGHKLQDDWNWCPWCRWETARGRRVKSNG